MAKEHPPTWRSDFERRGRQRRNQWNRQRQSHRRLSKEAAEATEKGRWKIARQLEEKINEIEDEFYEFNVRLHPLEVGGFSHE